MIWTTENGGNHKRPQWLLKGKKRLHFPKSSPSMILLWNEKRSLVQVRAQALVVLILHHHPVLILTKVSSFHLFLGLGCSVINFGQYRISGKLPNIIYCWVIISYVDVIYLFIVNGKIQNPRRVSWRSGWIFKTFFLVYISTSLFN